MPPAALPQLARRAAEARSSAELDALAAEGIALLVPHGLAALWLEDRGLIATRGMHAARAGAPFRRWLEQLGRELASNPAQQPWLVARTSLASIDPAGWHHWFPAYVLWVPLAGGGLLLGRDTAWGEHERALLAAWATHWSQAHARLRQPLARMRALLGRAGPRRAGHGPRPAQGARPRIR